jgi:hypothetical protein
VTYRPLSTSAGAVQLNRATTSKYKIMGNKKPSLKPAIPPTKVVRSAGANQPNPKTERRAPKPGANNTAEYWAPRINQHLFRSVSSLIEAGRELIAAT